MKRALTLVVLAILVLLLSVVSTTLATPGGGAILVPHPIVRTVNLSTLTPGVGTLPAWLALSRGAATNSGEITVRTGAATLRRGIATNAPRIYSDGAIVGLLHEDARANLIPNNIDQTAGTWGVGVGVTYTNGIADPAGGTAAQRVQITSGNYSNYYSVTSATAGIYTGSCWVQRGSVGGNVSGQWNHDTSIAQIIYSAVGLAAWAPFSSTATHTAGNVAIQPQNGGDLSSGGGLPAGVRDANMFGCQIELGPYMSSEIITSTLASTRPADVLSASSVIVSGSHIGLEYVLRPQGASTAYAGLGQELWYQDASNYCIAAIGSGGVRCNIQGANVSLPVSFPAFSALSALRVFTESGGSRLSHAWVSVNGTTTDLGYSGVPQANVLPASSTYLLSDNAGTNGMGTIVQGVTVYRNGYRPSWVNAYASTLPGPGRVALFAGNSLTSGVGASDPATTAYPARALALLGAPWTGTNAGVAGQTTADMIAGISTQIWPYTSVTARQVVVEWEGSNDIGGVVSGTTTLADCEARYVTYARDMHAFNSTRVIVLPIIPRRNTTWTNQNWIDWEAVRQAFNVWLAANWRTFADGYIDLNANAAFSSPTAYSNTSIYSVDQVHLIDPGYTLLASLVVPAIQMWAANDLSLRLTQYAANDTKLIVLAEAA